MNRLKKSILNTHLIRADQDLKSFTAALDRVLLKRRPVQADVRAIVSERPVPIHPMDSKTKEAKLIRLELLNLQRQLMTSINGLLSRLDIIDPPENPSGGKPRTKEQAKRHFSSLVGL